MNDVEKIIKTFLCLLLRCTAGYDPNYALHHSRESLQSCCKRIFLPLNLNDRKVDSWS